MDNDRELLERAAKAAGMEGCAVEYGDRLVFLEDSKPASTEWSPLTDDGDALRLAVKLGADVVTGGGRTIVYCQGTNAVEYHGDDPYAATRRAVVRAAAEIGRQHA